MLCNLHMETNECFVPAQPELQILTFSKVHVLTFAGYFSFEANSKLIPSGHLPRFQRASKRGLD